MQKDMFWVRVKELSVEKLVKNHAFCEIICEYSVEEPLKEGMVCVGRYVSFLWKSL